jgi:plastocyanin
MASQKFLGLGRTALILLFATLLVACDDDYQVDDSAGIIRGGPDETVTVPPFRPISSATPIGSATPPVGGTQTPAERQIRVVAKDNYFEPADLMVQAGETIELILVNEGTAIHNWRLLDAPTGGGEEPQTRLIPGGQEARVIFRVDRPGEYRFWCDVHPVEMVGTLRVR